MNRAVAGILLFVLLLLAGCVTPQATESTSVPASPQITGSTPVPFMLPTAEVGSSPVWQGLTPGKSTQQDVATYLATNAPDVTDHGVGGCNSYRSNTPGHTELSVEGGVLVYIQARPPYGTTLCDLVDRYGPPEYISSILEAGVHPPELYAQEIYYPAQGLAFKLTPDQTKVGHVEPGAEVRTGYYVTPGDLRHVLATRMACVVRDQAALKQIADKEVSRARPWTGFGKVEVVRTP